MLKTHLFKIAFPTSEWLWSFFYKDGHWCEHWYLTYLTLIACIHMSKLFICTCMYTCDYLICDTCDYFLIVTFTLMSCLYVYAHMWLSYVWHLHWCLVYVHMYITILFYTCNCLMCDIYIDVFVKCWRAHGVGTIKKYIIIIIIIISWSPCNTRAKWHSSIYVYCDIKQCVLPIMILWLCTVDGVIYE